MRIMRPLLFPDYTGIGPETFLTQILIAISVSFY